MVELPNKFDASADKLLVLEQNTASRASKYFSAPFRRLLILLYAVWPGDSASEAEKAAALARLNTEIYLAPLGKVEAVLLKGVMDAFAMGVSAGVTQSGLGWTPQTMAFKQQVPDWLVLSVRATQQVIRRALGLGGVLLSRARTLQQAREGLMSTNPTSKVTAHARWLTNRASNEGLTLVGESDLESVLVWRAERDACVHCLAYQGQSRIDGSYPMGLTFGAKPLHTDPVPMPPLHPNCRCTQWVLKRDVAKPVQIALVREAQRSILRGWSLESESNAVRVDAARKLLAKNPAMPKSVKTYARDAVKQGKFKRGRQFPD